MLVFHLSFKKNFFVGFVATMEGRMIFLNTDTKCLTSTSDY